MKNKNDIVYKYLDFEFNMRYICLRLKILQYLELVSSDNAPRGLYGNLREAVWGSSSTSTFNFDFKRNRKNGGEVFLEEISLLRVEVSSPIKASAYILLL